jgi:hypothetical protein
MYLDGQLVTNLTFDWDAKIDYDIPMPVEIGALTGFTDTQFVGGIDDVNFYDRTLTLPEIQTLAQVPDSTSTFGMLGIGTGVLLALTLPRRRHLSP